MSTFPQHIDNIRNLERIGFDVSGALEDGSVTMESWGYDELVYLMEEVICEIETNWVLRLWLTQ